MMTIEFMDGELTRGRELALRSNLRQIRKVGPTHGRFRAVNAKKNTTAKLNYVELETSDCFKRKFLPSGSQIILHYVDIIVNRCVEL